MYFSISGYNIIWRVSTYYHIAMSIMSWSVYIDDVAAKGREGHGK